MVRTIPVDPSQQEASAPDDPLAPIIADFRTAITTLKAISSDRVMRLGLSMAQLNILYTLKRCGEMPMSRLADMLDVSDSNASGVIDRLEERGYVERVRVPDDRRVVHVRATDAGRQMLTEAEVLKDEMVQRVLDRLDAGQLERLAHAVDDLGEAALTAFPDLAQHDHVH